MTARIDKAPAADQAAISNVAAGSSVFDRRWIDPDHLRLTPTAGAVTPAARIVLACLLIDLGALAADRRGLSAVAPAHERCDPGTRLPSAGEWPAGVVQPILQRAEPRLRVGVVVANSWPGEGSEHTQLLQPALQQCGTRPAYLLLRRMLFSNLGLV
jgi:hypothetical protein